jgi:hypothetical protein
MTDVKQKLFYYYDSTIERLAYIIPQSENETASSFPIINTRVSDCCLTLNEHMLCYLMAKTRHI